MYYFVHIIMRSGVMLFELGTGIHLALRSTWAYAKTNSKSLGNQSLGLQLIPEIAVKGIIILDIGFTRCLIHIICFI